MNAPATTLAAPASWPWELWGRQWRAVVALEVRRNLLTRRGLWIYLLALAPVALTAAQAVIVQVKHVPIRLEEYTSILAGLFQLFTLRLGIFFGCMGIFTRLFRGEVQERSLHYYFLAPIRRELLLLGKFTAGVLISSLIFGLSTLLCFVLMYVDFGAAGREFVFHGPGLGHLFWYLLVTVLACAGYGALFLALGLLFGNPIISAAVVLLWESINGVLPVALKKLSLIFYLTPLCPVEVPAKDLLALLTVVADPPPAWVSIASVLGLTAVILLYAARQVRRMEIRYTSD